MTLALGIDPGTATTGYGLVRLTREGELVAVAFGIISTPKESPAPARLEMLYKKLRSLLRKYKPEKGVKPTHYLPSQLKMWKLVFAHRNNLPLIKGNIGSHENRITHQPIIDVIRLHLNLLLKRRNA